MPATAGAAQSPHEIAASGTGRSRALRPGALDARLSLLLGAGGDERIGLDPLTGRTRYGTGPGPAPTEIWFSSSTASAISPAGYRAGLRALEALHAPSPTRRLQLQDWLNGLRSELVAGFGRSNSEAVLSASGTDAELIVLAIASSLLARPLTNIVVAPDETGSGVGKAASGCHFLPTSCLGGPVPAGERLAGWADADIEVVCIDIRSPDGRPREPVAIDRDVAVAAERALARGRGVLLHVLDASKTGLSGPSRDMTAWIADQAPERVCVMVDACQLRCPPSRLRSDLDRGFMVLITGSKFAGGPPLSGALLLPEAVATRLRAAPRPPAGLADYSARFDWPEALQATFASELAATANLGAGLRWTAALAEIARFAAIDPALVGRFLARFVGEVHARAAASLGMALLHDAAHGAAPTPSIVPLAVRRRGGWASRAEAAELWAGLRTPDAGHGRIIHVGQPVAVGPRAVLRVCASAPQASDAADRIAAGASFEEAFAPVSRDLEALFAKLGHLCGDCA